MAGIRGRRSSRKRRGDGGGGERAAEQTHQDSCHHSDNTICQQNPTDQDYPFSPGFSLRYPTRRSRAALAQVATLPSPLRNPLRSIKTPSQSSSLNPTMRILNDTSDQPLPRDKDIELLEFQHCNSQPIGEDLVCENTVKDVDTSVSTRSPSWSFPVSMEPISQCQGPQDAQQVAPQASSHQDLLDSYPPSSENYVVSHIGDKPEKSTTNYVHRNSRCLSTSQSLNITEFAKRLQDDLDDDPEEVESAFGPAFDCVNGHKVKIEIVSLLRAIFEKYGDITTGTNVKSSNILSLFLERVCDIYERLERTTFFDVTCIELNDMLDEVRYFEREKLNVRWLLERLEYISQTKISFQEYLSVKEEEAKYDASIGSLETELEAYQRELSDLHQKISLVQQKITAAKAELVVQKVKADQSKKVVLDIKARVNTLRRQTLEQQINDLVGAAAYNSNVIHHQQQKDGCCNP